MTSESHVYIVQLANEQRLKIGKADTVFTRLDRLELLTTLDPNRSWQVQCPAKEARLLEKLLQARMNDYHISDLPYSDGYTEWFDSACYDDLMAFVRSLVADKHYTLEVLEISDMITPKEPAVKNEMVQFNKRIDRHTADSYRMLSVRTGYKIPELLTEGLRLLEARYEEDSEHTEF